MLPVVDTEVLRASKEVPEVNMILLEVPSEASLTSFLL